MRLAPAWRKVGASWRQARSQAFGQRASGDSGVAVGLLLRVRQRANQMMMRAKVQALKERLASKLWAIWHQLGAALGEAWRQPSGQGLCSKVTSWRAARTSFIPSNRRNEHPDRALLLSVHSESFLQELLMQVFCLYRLLQRAQSLSKEFVQELLYTSEILFDLG